MKTAGSATEYMTASFAVEKLSPSEAALDLCRRMEAGETTADAAIRSILMKYHLKQGKEHV